VITYKFNWTFTKTRKNADIPRDSSIRPPGEITDLCQTFVKLRTYTYIHARDVSLASAASSSALCGTRRGKFIYSRRSVFNPDARFDARLRETPDPKRSPCVRLYACTCAPC